MDSANTPEVNTFDTQPMASVLDELINQNGATVGSGWTEKTEYDYARYNSDSGANGQTSSGFTFANEDNVPWAADAEKYEFVGDEGDIGPPHPALEAVLFTSEFLMRTGLAFDQLNSIRVTEEGTVKVAPVREFADAGLHPQMLANIKLCKYEKPTPIQAYCLPAILKGYDVIACAQTGSGKTAAFLIPTLSKLMGKARELAAPRPDPTNPATFGRIYRAEPLILIVAPTRELATQIFDEARRFCYRSMLRPCVVYGGAPVSSQREELLKGCDILIGTPGRLCDFMNKPHVLSMSRLKYTIIDEADEMLRYDWNHELEQIMSGGDTNDDADHVYMMFSATFPKGARALAKGYMSQEHVRFVMGRAGSSHMNVKQGVVFVEPSQKNQALYDLLFANPPTRSMIFVNTKHTADQLDDYLFNRGLPTTSIHSQRTQREREDAIRSFRSGKCPILITTGVGARGIDIKNVMHVINYDLPSVARGGIGEYIHRIGRTARIGNTGLATSFFNEGDGELAHVLVKVLLETKQTIPDFLAQYAPTEGEAIEFDDDKSDDELYDKAKSDDQKSGNGLYDDAKSDDDMSDDDLYDDAKSEDRKGNDEEAVAKDTEGSAGGVGDV